MVALPAIHPAFSDSIGTNVFKKYMAHGRLKQLQGEHSPFGIWLSNSLHFLNPNISQW